MLISFVLFPAGYNFYVSFTNWQTGHILTKTQVIERLEDLTYSTEEQKGVEFDLYVMQDSNLDFFYTPSEIFLEEIPENKRIKIGGMVLENSVIREKTKIYFIVSDFQGSINVEFDGIVPDLFKEGSGVVVLGYLKDKTIIAEEVLAKHDENYMPPSIDIEK